MNKEYAQLLRIVPFGNITFDLDVEKYSVSISSPVFKAIDRLAESGNEILYCLDSKNHLVGKFSVDKLQKWLLSDNFINLRTPLSEIVTYEANAGWDVQAFPALKDGESVLRSNGGTVPLTDEINRIVAIACLNNETLKIGAHSIGKASKTFIIAEIGINHNGDPQLAKRMVDEARKAGADCAKFQLRSLKSLYTNQGDPNDIIGPMKGFYRTGVNWRIVKILEKNPGELTGYSEKMDNNIKDKMMSEQRDAILEKYRNELLKKYTYKIFVDKIKGVDPLAIP